MAISRFSANLDSELDSWRERIFMKEYRYVVVDARYESRRVDGEIIDIAIMIAIGIDSDGYRHVLGVETSWGETSDSWYRFIGGLKQRGLRGVRLFTNDDHPGIYPAIKRQYPGAIWQRCQRHFLVNALDRVPRSQWEVLHELLKQAWDSDTYREAKDRLDQISVLYENQYPDLAAFISVHDWETLGVYDAALVEHHKRLRTTNMIERMMEKSDTMTTPGRFQLTIQMP